MRIFKKNKFTLAAYTTLARCPVCHSERGVMRGVFVDHYGKVEFVLYTRRQRKAPYCLGSGMKANAVSGETRSGDGGA